MPDLVKAGFKDSTAPATVTCYFHDAGLLKGQAESAPTSDAPAQSAGLIPAVQLIQSLDTEAPEHLSVCQAGPDGAS
ncbi:hypothetical protein [Paenarthrobacter aurescens]|jgi:hypothetical protein|nr:hypothetical protein [Paenarthrobacter aurescens]